MFVEITLHAEGTRPSKIWVNLALVVAIGVVEANGHEGVLLFRDWLAENNLPVFEKDEVAAVKAFLANQGR